MQLRLIKVAALLSSIAAIDAGTASAQNADAELLFSEGNRAEAAGQIEKACTAFAASNKLEPRAGTLVRLGGCYEKQAKLASAWSAYKDALTRAKDAAKRAFAEERIAAIEPRLSKLTIVVADKSKLPGLIVRRDNVELPEALWGTAAPIDGGTHAIEVLAPDHQAWKTTVQLAPHDDNKKVDVPVLPKVATEAPTVVAETVDEPSEVPNGMSTKRKLAIGIGAAGVAIGVAAIVMGVQSRNEHDRAFSLCPDPAAPCADAASAQDHLDHSNSRATLANIGFAVGGAAIITSGVLWFLGAPAAEDHKRVVVRAHIDTTTASLGLFGQF